MRNLKAKVEHILDKYPESRNSDTNLTFLIIAHYYPDEMIKVRNKFFFSGDVLKEVREDNVKRIRALFNHKGMYLPTNPVVLRQRGIAEREWHNEIALEGKRPIKVIL